MIPDDLYCFMKFIFMVIIIKLPSAIPLCRYDDQFVVAAFDNAPTVDSEMYTKLDKSVRDDHESRVSYGSKIYIIYS